MLLGEYGVRDLGNPPTDVQDVDYGQNVTMDAWVIGGMSNGVDGTAKWSYSNKDDIDGRPSAAH